MAWELILKSREDTFRETATLRLDGAIADIVETLQSMERAVPKQNKYLSRPWNS